MHHERQWVINSTISFYQNKLITDLTRLVKGGKEANVYVCTAGENVPYELLAAKLYRPRNVGDAAPIDPGPSPPGPRQRRL